MLFAAAMLVCATPAAAKLRECSETEAALPRIRGDAATAHLLTPRPVVSYPPATDRRHAGDFIEVYLVVDAEGRPLCAGPYPGFRADLLPEFEALWNGMEHWRYAPFERDGRAAPTRIVQYVETQILPARRVPVPPIEADTLSVTLVHAHCYFGCPQYAVNVRGDGRVGYVGLRHVDVTGEHAWRIPAADAARLVALASDPLLWSADDRYVASVTDAETTLLRVDAGGHRKQIVAYAGEYLGMPVVVRRLREAIDALAKTSQWVVLSHVALDQLEREGFDFASPEAEAMLGRARGSRQNSLRDHVDPSAIERLERLRADAAERP